MTSGSARNMMKWRTRLTEPILPSVQVDTPVQQHHHPPLHHYHQQQYDIPTIPIICAPMAGVAGGKLAASVCHAGGMGMIGAGHLLSDPYNNSNSNNNNNNSGLDILEKEIDIFHEYNQSVAPTKKFPLCIGFIGYSTFAKRIQTIDTTTSMVDKSNNDSVDSIDGGGWERLQYIIEKYQPAMIQFFAPAICYRQRYIPTSTDHTNHQHDNGESNVQFVHRVSHYHTKVYVQVCTVKDAINAVQNHNVDGIIVQGTEAGGHGIRREYGSSTLSLLNTVIQSIRGSHYINDVNVKDSSSMKQYRNTTVPIFAAGGIVDGPSMAAVMTLGCDGVVIGTRFWATHESLGLQSYKDALVSTKSCDDIIRTTIFDTIQNRYSKTPWPHPYDSVGAIKNETYYQWEDYSPQQLIDVVSSTNDDGNANGDDILQSYQNACQIGDTNIALVHSGEGIGCIHAIESAYDVVHTINNDAISILQNTYQRFIS